MSVLITVPTPRHEVFNVYFFSRFKKVLIRFNFEKTNDEKTRNEKQYDLSWRTMKIVIEKQRKRSIKKW